MQPPELPEKLPHNLNNELAKERTRAAADRTLMAWIRTSLSLIGSGFGIPTIVQTIETTQIGRKINSHHFTNGIGLAFISIGIFAMYSALKEHRLILRQIQSDRYTYQSYANAERISIALLLVGLASFLAILINAINL
jgi:putative membrane protein